jgi:hypothetical protein
MLVELDVFSGRPNPQWELDEPTANELRRIMGGLTATTNELPVPPGLGYRGFILADGSGQSRVYKGYVTRANGVFADPSFTVERFLLDRLPVELQGLRSRVALQNQP